MSLRNSRPRIMMHVSIALRLPPIHPSSLPYDHPSVFFVRPSPYITLQDLAPFASNLFHFLHQLLWCSVRIHGYRSDSSIVNLLILCSHFVSNSHGWALPTEAHFFCVRRSDREKSRGSPLDSSAFYFTRRLGIAMSSTKPLDVTILPANRDNAESPWEPYQEYGGSKIPTNDWSCYILAKEGDVSGVGVIVAVRAYAYSDLDIFSPMQKYDGETPRGPDLR